MHQRITGPLGMSSTALPLPRDLLGRAVQGYSPQGQPIGKPGMKKGELSSGQAPAKSIRRRATWPRSWPRTWANLPTMAQ